MSVVVRLTFPSQRLSLPVLSSTMREVIAVSLLGLAVLCIYAQVGAHRTIGFDDSLYLTDNAWVKRGLTWEGFIWAFTNVDAANWHPVTWISHMVDQELFGALIGGHMIENPIWHFGNSFLVYRLFLALRQSRSVALALALVFVCHPLNVESVAWLSQRKTQISTFMLLATVLVYLDWRVTKRFSSRVLLTIAYLISLMSKAMGVTLPVLLLAYELLLAWPQIRADWVLKARRIVALRVWNLGVQLWPLVAAACLVAVATFFAQRHSGAVASLDRIPLEYRVLNAWAAVGTYLRTFFWPSELCLFYPLPPVARWGEAALGFFLVALGSLFAALGARRVPLVAFGWIWFLVSLLPVIGLVQVGSQSHADRYMYVPMLGLLIAVGAWFTEVGLPAVRRPRLAWSALTFSFAAGMGLHAYAYTMLWRDAETAYRRSIEVGGVSYAMASNLAATLTNLHYYKTAEVYSNLCVQLWPDHALVVGNHASVLALLGKHQESEIWYRRAMALDPKEVKFPYMYALLLLQVERNEEAEIVLNEALRLLPSEDDWSSGNQMIRRILLRQVPLSDLGAKPLVTADTTPAGNQREPK